MPRDSLLIRDVSGSLRDFVKHAVSSVGPNRSRLAPDPVAKLLGAVGEVCAIEADESINRNLLSFVTQTGLCYPSQSTEIVELSEKCTAVLQKLEGTHSVFAELSTALASERHPKVSLSAYISTRESHKLGMHVDLWDNIVVQLSGSKVFLFEDSTAQALNSGDMLFIPQGTRHDVRTPLRSVHLSVVLLKATWLTEQGW